MLTTGSLFDGIGGFPLAALRQGLTPVWASEIAADCISITKHHFPYMEHLGDIKKINGAEIEPVDIITFGSPCQDLSRAGKRIGLKGDNSSLFMEAIRVIKEMRIKHGKPDFIVWENVPGAFNSNKGEDFRMVIEEIAKITESVSIPKPYQNKWLAAGAVMGNGWSLAWRVLNAQYWGVPQRRSRIFLVADFTGQRAGEILFKPESVPRDFESGEKARKNNAAGIGKSIKTAGFNGWRSATGTLEYEEARAPCIQANMPSNVIQYSFQSFGQYKQNNISKSHMACDDITTADLIAIDYTVRRMTPLEIERCFGFPDFWTAYGHNGKAISDTARYRALGNSVAIPCVEYVMNSLATNKSL